MRNLTRRLAASTGSIGVIIGCMTFASAAPTHVLPAVHGASMRAVGTFGRPVVRGFTAPVFHAFAIRRVTSPIGAVPVAAIRAGAAVGAGKVGVFPAFLPPRPFAPFSTTLPRFALSALLSPLSHPCATARRDVPVVSLPTTPYFSDACAQSRLPADVPTSLVSGKNKNALYGPAYAPSAGELP